ncbi:non-ribosomal peptide synthetase [Nocardia altamirensis]|uniref:non-ribosomal peptide synthetase n=1 Tax=Nocardia altamirensis TaxID=472158 RepID=UPI0008403847|nr:non-ribosomal peptide synthetase [Nocardia altamirensis]
MTETPRSRITDIMPLTPLQEGLLFVSTLDENVDVYTVQATLDITGPLDGERLRAAAQAVLDRHPNLRACFRARKSGEPVALIPSLVDIPWRSIDLSTLAHEDQDRRWAAILDADRGNRFDLATPPLLRFTMATLGHHRFRLLLTNHHMLLDGWSSPLFVRELFTMYTSTDQAALPAPRPYRDFLRWLQDQDRDGAAAAWRAALADVSGPTMLAPVGATRKAARPQRHTLQLSADIGARLGERARDLGVTVNSIVSAAWGLVLGHAVDATDALFGATVSGRSPDLDGVESMIGMFLGTAVVRVRTSPQDCLADVVRRTHETNTATMDHQHLGLPAIQRVAGHGELFDTLLVFESYPDARDALAAVTAAAGLEITSVQPRDSTHYPLTVTVILEPRLTIHLFYHSTVFDASEIAAIARQFTALLELITDQPKTPLSLLDLCDDAARATLARWQAGSHLSDQVRAVTAVIDDHAADPAAVAIRSAGIEWTYAELATATARLAAALRDRGVGPEDRVVIALPRGGQFAAAMLAVLRVGAVYVPIDLGYPRERIAHILTDSAPVLVIGALDADVPMIAPAALPETTTTPPSADFDPRHPAYLVYTSGSTGRPKGVLGTRAALHRRIEWAVAQWHSTQPEIRLSKSSFAFIDGSTELLAGLAAGALVVLATDAESRDTAALARLVVDEQVTQLTAVPTLAAELIANHPALAERVSTWVLSGEPTNPALVTQLRAGNPNNRIINSYGSSEVAGDVTWHDLGPDDVAVGAPVPGVDLEVLDRYLRQVAPGAVGELYVRGPQVARGYHRNPGATAARFVAGHGGVVRYATGDLVRWRADGVLDYLGRADQQVKIRGNRVEPGEVDAALATVPGVHGSATVAVTDATGAIALRAFVVGPDLDPGAVRRTLADRLPPYLVPAVEIIAEIPRLPGGKVDRRALAGRTATATASVAPRTELERELCAIVAEVLAVTDFGVEDDFFARGGHSLLAARVAIRVQAELGHTVSVRMIFDHPTVAELANELAVNPGSAPKLPALEARSHGATIELSSAQRRLLAVEQIVGGSVPYNLSFVLALSGPLDATCLAAALTDVVDRHAALRTLIVETDGEPVQQILPPGQPLAFSQRNSTPDTVVADVAELAAQPFRLDREPPIRAALLRTGPDQHTLLICMHHVAGDEWSTPIIFRDLATAYRERVLGGAPAWQQPSPGYADYAVWQRDLVGNAEAGPLAAQRAFWRDTLADAPEELGLPYDRPRPERADFGGDAVEFRIDAARADDLARLGRDAGATGFMVAHALLGVLLAKVTGARDLVVGTPVSGRAGPGMESIVGLFTNTVALRVDLHGNPDFAEVLRRVRAADLAAFDHQDLPFDAVAELIGQPRVPGRTPLFQTMVQYRTPITVPDFAGLTAEVRHAPVRSAKFDLTFDFLEQADRQGISVRIEYSTALFDRATVRAVADRLLLVIDAVTADSGTPLRSIPVTAPPERHRILHEWNNTHAQVDPNLDLPGLISRGCHANADRIALLFGDERLSYRELDSAVTALADQLAARGIGADDIVAVALERSFALFVAVLAVHRCGAAYLPVDRSYPAERLRYLFADARPGLLITDLPLDSATEPPNGDVPVLLVDPNGSALGTAVAPAPATADATALPPSRAAYVIYTSGSTGQPKGVVVSHAAIVNRLLWMQHEYGLRPDERVLHKTPITFDVSVWELFWPLAVGATVVIAEPDGHRDPAYLAELIRRTRVSTVHFVPSMLGAFLAEPAVADHPLPELTRVLCSGEALSPALRDRFHDRLTAQLHNLYGPTEAAVDVTATPVKPEAGSIVPIGAPVWNTQIYVLDRDLAPLPVGGYGDIYLAGVQLARGYLGRAALTSAHFVANPFAANGSRLYRTGDIGRWSPTGLLEYAGRGDNQVKIRGQRIELGEIEAALLDCAEVVQAAALVHTYRTGRHNIVGYVVPSAGATLDVTRITAELANRLPAHMIPAAVLAVDALPVTANGKLDRRALAALTPEPSTVTAEEPMDDRETLVAAAVSEITGVERVGPDSDFFALGGDSIVALSLVGRLRKRGLELSAREVFEHRTVRAMAAAATVAQTIVHDDTVGDVPLTPIVSRLAQRRGPSSRLNQTVVVRIPPATGLTAVQSVATALVARHDALRLRLTRVQDQVWTLRTDPAGTVPIEALVHDATAAAAPIAETLAELADAAADRLDPDAGIVVQFVHVDRGADASGFLVVVAHHLVVDGASWRILLEDLATAGAGGTLDPVPVSLRSYAQAMVTQAQSAPRLRELAHWRDVLAPGADLVAGPHDSGVMGELSHLDIEVGDAVAAAVLAPARPIPTTDLLLAALRVAVTRWRARTGSADHALVVDVERHGRDGLGGLDLTRTVGWLTNVTPVRLPAHEDIESTVFATAAAMAAAPDGGIGFGLLRYGNPRAARVLAALPQPQVLFNYLGRVEFGAAQDWRVAPESRAVSVAPNADLAVEYPLEINIRAEAVAGKTVLRARFTFLPKVIRHTELAVIAELWAQALLETTDLTKATASG